MGTGVERDGGVGAIDAHKQRRPFLGIVWT